MTQNRAAPGVYDPLETVLYFKYCIHPGSICTPKWGTKNDVPQVPQNGVQFGVLVWQKYGAGGQINTEYLKTRVFRGFLEKNPKIEIF